jgi:hypothetical protein
VTGGQGANVATVNELVRFALVAFFPRVGDLPGLAELGVDEKIVALRRESTRFFWTGMVAAAVFFQLSPILTVGRPFPAVLLTEEQLDAHAHRLATHPVYLIRQLIVLLKLMAGVFWGQSPEIRAFLQLPAYGDDPGTCRVEAAVGRSVPSARAPVEALVELGRREAARGRGPGGAFAGHAADCDVRKAQDRG